MTRQLMAMFLGVVAVAAIAAGCGSSDDGDDPAPLTKGAFTKQANAICAKSSDAINKDLATLVKKYETEDKQLGVAQRDLVAETVLLPNFETQTEELSELGVPEGDEEEVSNMLDAFEEGLEEGADDPAAFVVGNTASFSQAIDLAAQYGLEGCGQI